MSVTDMSINPNIGTMKANSTAATPVVSFIARAK
jgi:hypothetical protein